MHIPYLMNIKFTIPHHLPFQAKLRFSAGLIKYDNQWLIVQSHLSAPLAEQKVGGSFPN